jgi:hypothetical protein
MAIYIEMGPYNTPFFEGAGDFINPPLIVHVYNEPSNTKLPAVYIFPST